MGNPQAAETKRATATTSALAQRYYGLGIPAQSFRNASILQALGMQRYNPSITAQMANAASVTGPNQNNPRGGGNYNQMGSTGVDEGAALAGGGGASGNFTGPATSDVPPPDEFTQMGPNAGSPLYVRNAFSQQRAGLTDASALAGRASAGKAVAGGTNAAVLAPRDIGAEIARATSKSNLMQSLSQIEQTTNLLGMGFGGAGNTGSEGMAAAGNQLGSIASTQTMSNGGNALLASLAGASAIYGAGNQAGWWNSNGATPVAAGTSPLSGR